MAGLRRSLTVFAAGSLAASALLAVSATATAAPPELDGWHDVVTDEFEDCGVPVRLEVDVRGRFIGRVGRDGLQYAAVHENGTIVLTNLETGKAVTQRFSVTSRDILVTDNGDGTLTILVRGQGSESYFGPTGGVFVANPGQVSWEILIDHGGTPGDWSDDEFLEYLGPVSESTGRNDAIGRDFCEDFLMLTA